MKPKNFLQAAVLLSALASVGVSGCVENESSLFVIGLVPFGDDCTVEEEVGATLTGGTYDLQFGLGYVVNPILGNQLRAVGDPDVLRTETNHIQIQGAEVSVERPGGGAVAGPFTVPAVGLVDAGESEFGTGVTSITAIPAEAIDEPGNYIVNLVIFGETLGGVEVDTGPFGFPLTVCRDCLLICDTEFESDPGAACTPGSNGRVGCSDLGVCGSSLCN